MKTDQCILVLGGAGLVGAQIVREIARELEPETHCGRQSCSEVK